MPRWLLACCLIVLFAAPAAVLARGSESFPFGSELMFDTTPMYGSKRVPSIEIEEDGSAAIDLWCGSVRAQANVGSDGTIAIAAGTRNNGTCDPERIAGDDDLLDMLLHLTSWRRKGDLVEFSGAPGTMRFHLMTN